MKGFSFLAGLCLGVSLFTTPASAIQCGDCGNPVECGSALSCMDLPPGTACGGGRICIDLNHLACGAIVRCCGCEEGMALTKTHSPALAIPDGNPAGLSSSILVDESRIVVDMDVYLEIDHTRVGDLVVTLTHEATTVTIVDRPGHPAVTGGCDADLSSTRRIYLSDEASRPVECSPAACSSCFPGGQVPGESFIPNGSLSAFDGHDVLGEWRLTVSDLRGGDTGTLSSWGLVVVGAGPVAAIPASWSTVKSVYR